MPVEDVLIGLDALAEARDRYEEAEAYYEGSNPELFASPKIARALRTYEARFRLRLSKVPVDAVVNKLEIAAITVAQPPGPEGDPVPDENLTQLLQDEIRDRNEMELEEDLVHAKACMYGDAYVIVTQDPDTDEIELFYNSPYEVRIVYDRDGRHKLFAIKAWSEEDETGREFKRADLYYNDAIESWITKPNARGDQMGDWLPHGPGSPQLDERGQALLVEVGRDPEDRPVMDVIIEPGVFGHNYGQIPVFHFRTNRPYGKPEHEAAYGPQDMIDKLIVTQMATVDFQGFPQRYALMDPNAEEADSEDWEDDDASAITPSVAKSKYKAGPGSVWWMEGAKSVGQFAVAEADAFLKPLERYVRGMSTVTDTPLHLFDAAGVGPTGESRRVAEAGQTKKVKKRQRQFGGTWRDVYAFCLYLLKGEDLTDRIDVRWVPAESLDPAEAWDLAAKKKGVGLPLERILLEHGYTMDQIVSFKSLWEEETRKRIELQREAFAASHQQNRDDRPDQPAPAADDQGGAA
jgi:hypothetical protein